MLCRDDGWAVYQEGERSNGNWDKAMWGADSDTREGVLRIEEININE